MASESMRQNGSAVLIDVLCFSGDHTLRELCLSFGTYNEASHCKRKWNAERRLSTLSTESQACPRTDSNSGEGEVCVT